MNAANRLSYLNNFKKFLSTSSEKLDQICESLGWDATVLNGHKEDESLVTCPVNPGHAVPPGKLDSHVEHCILRQAGYGEDEIIFPSGFEGGGPTITLTQRQQASVIQAAAALDSSIPTVSLVTAPEVPQSVSHLITSMTPQQRLALYEHAVQETAANAVPSPQLTELDLAFESKNVPKPEKSKTLLQILIEQRDAKRRRINYRQAKKVHTKHKSHTEVTREVIENRMELYKEWLEQSEKPTSSKEENETKANEYNRKEEYSEERKPSFEARSGSPKQKHHESRAHSRERYRHSYSSSRHRRDHSKGRHHHEEKKSRYYNEVEGKHYDSHCNRISDECGNDKYESYKTEKHKHRKKRYHSPPSERHKHSHKRKYKDR